MKILTSCQKRVLLVDIEDIEKEVIAIDDCSTDDTMVVWNSLKNTLRCAIIVVDGV